MEAYESFPFTPVIKRVIAALAWLKAHLEVLFGHDGISVHAVLLQRQVVLAAASSFVSAGHDPEPALLTLWRGRGQLRMSARKKQLLKYILGKNLNFPELFKLTLEIHKPPSWFLLLINTNSLPPSSGWSHAQWLLPLFAK